MPSDALALAIVLAGTGSGAAIDLRTRRVPNRLTMSLAGAGIGLAAMGLGRIDMVAAVAGCAVGLLLMLPGYLLGATGGGDVKLLAAVGTVLGPTDIMWAFIFTLITGGAFALMVAAYRSQLRLTVNRSLELVRTAGANAGEIESSNAGNRFAYAPAIAVGATIAAVFV